VRTLCTSARPRGLRTAALECPFCARCHRLGQDCEAAREEQTVVSKLVFEICSALRDWRPKRKQTEASVLVIGCARGDQQMVPPLTPWLLKV